MAWARFDDKRHTNAKLLAAGLEANGLDANAITYCAANETDGFIPDAALPLLGVGARTPVKKLAQRLVEVGRWERDDEHGGHRVHDYLHYNEAHAQAEERREREREKKAKQRTRGSAAVDHDTDGRFMSRGDNGGTQRGSPPGTPPGSPEGSPPLTRPVPSSVVKSSSEEPLGSDGAADDDDRGLRPDDDRQAAARELAERDLACREAERGPVVHRERWLEAATRRRLAAGDLTEPRATDRPAPAAQPPDFEPDDVGPVDWEANRAAVAAMRERHR